MRLTPNDPRKIPAAISPNLDRALELTETLSHGDLSVAAATEILRRVTQLLEDVREANIRLMQLVGEIQKRPRYLIMPSGRTRPSKTWNVLDTKSGLLVRTDNGARVRAYSTEKGAQERADGWNCVCQPQREPEPRTHESK